MALQIPFEDKCGVVHEAAYFRIRRAIVENFPTDVSPMFTAEVEVYHSLETRQARKAPIDTIIFQLAEENNPAMQSGLTSAYDFLKILPDFEGAKDV
ncbi:MAG: hypothetical protein WC600_17250 [Desulfobaccales bacterium]